MKWHPRCPNILVSGSAPGMIVVWDVFEKRIKARVFLDIDAMVNSIDFHPTFLCRNRLIHRKDLVMFCCDDSVFLWDYEVALDPCFSVVKSISQTNHSLCESEG